MMLLSQTPKSARLIALSTLDEFDRTKGHNNSGRGYAGVILDKFLGQTDQRQKATDLVFGVIRHYSAINTVLASLADCPVARISRQLLNIVRIGVYELIYRPETPEYSIINEAVENAKRITTKKHAGFVNALLRKLAAAIKNREIALTDSDSKSTLPQTSCSGCEFNRPFLPDQSRFPADYFSIVFTLPKWLVTGWIKEYGVDRTREICFASNRRPSVYLRPNTLKTSTYRLAEILSHEKIDCEITSDEFMIKLNGSKSVTGLPGFEEGLFIVQDPAAAKPARVLNAKAGHKILDLCAAPGVKTTQLSELTKDKAIIVATDIHSRRAKKIEENISRLGINNVKVVPYDLEKIQREFGLFDAVLLDVPCSNTGVLAKRPEVRLKVRASAIAKLRATQLKLLDCASQMITPSGKICYCTCSLQKEENSGCVKDFLTRHRDFKLKAELLTFPSAEDFDHDGSYYAVITRK